MKPEYLGEGSQASSVEPDRSEHPGSFLQVLRETFALYRRHGVAFTVVLLPSLFSVLLGAYGGLLLSDGLIQMSTNSELRLQPYYGLLMILLLGLIGFGTIFCVLQGSWKYLIYCASLNINAVEVSQGKPPDFRRAYHEIAVSRSVRFQRLMTVYCALPLLFPFMLFIPYGAIHTLIVSSGIAPQVQSLLVLLFGILGFVWIILFGILGFALMMLSSFILQIVAIEPTASVYSVFKRSARLVLNQFWSVTGLQLLLGLMNSYFLPAPVIFVLRKLQLLSFADRTHQWLIQKALEVYTGPIKGFLADNVWFTVVQDYLPNTASSATDMVIAYFIAALLLPLGTFAFTLFYLNGIKSENSLRK